MTQTKCPACGGALQATDGVPPLVLFDQVIRVCTSGCRFHLLLAIGEELRATVAPSVFGQHTKNV